MPTYKYIADRVTFLKRPVPGQEGVKEYLFYIRAGDLPGNVPHGCNPRDQDINARTYRKVGESLCDRDDMTFHLKNKGITVLAESVRESHEGDRVVLTVEIPNHLGNVDGQHTHEIVTKYKEKNPDQLVPVRILEKLPSHLISSVAAGLNTSVQVTSATMADHYGLFESVQDVLRKYEYADWIGYRQNAHDTSASSKDLVSLMWVCNPTIFEENIAWHPSWVFSRGASVYDKFYTEKEKEFRAKLLQMVHVLPDIISLYRHLNENVSDYFRSRRRKRTPEADINDNKEYEISVEDLCVSAVGLPFRDPSDRSKHKQLKDCYRLILVSGLRSLLTMDRELGCVVWKVDYPLVREILDRSLKKIYSQLVRQLRQNKRDHNVTSRQPALWDLPAQTIGMTHLEEYANRTKTMCTPPPHSVPEPRHIPDKHGQQQFDLSILDTLN